MRGLLSCRLSLVALAASGSVVLVVLVILLDGRTPDAAWGEAHQRRTAADSMSTSTALTKSWQGVPFSPGEGLPPFASVHCSGENFHASRAWEYKTCHFQNICYDRQTAEFIGIASPTEAVLAALWEKRSGYDRSTVTMSTLLSSAMNAVSLGPLAAKDNDSKVRENVLTDALPTGPWFPTVLSRERAQVRYRLLDKEPAYAQLADEYVGIPTSLVSSSPWATQQQQDNENGRWLWETAYPLFLAAHLFGLTDNNDGDAKEASRNVLWPLLLTQHGGKNGNDYYQAWRAKLVQTYAPATILPGPLLDVNESNEEDEAVPRLMCMKHAVAGIGRLGPSSAASLLEQSDSIGRGTMLQAFFEHVQKAVAVHPIPSANKGGAATGDVASVRSLPDSPRVLVDTSCQREDHQKLLAHLEGPSSSDANTWPYHSAHLAKLPLVEQARLLSQATVLVTCLQGGSIAAPLFLPPQARVFLLYQASQGDRTTSVMSGKHDDDDDTSLYSYVWNNAAFLRTSRINTDQVNEVGLRGQIQAALDE
jgi:hypothetical protein